MFKNLNNIQKIIILIFVAFFIADLLGFLQDSWWIGNFFVMLGMYDMDARNMGIIVYVFCIIGFFLFKTRNKTQD